MTTGKTIALTRWTFVGKVMSLLFNMLSRFVIGFLLRSKRLLISLLQLPSAVILKPPKIKPFTVSIVYPSIYHEAMGIPDHLTCLLRNPHVGQEATVRTGHGTTDWFQIGKGVRQGCILSPFLFNCNVHHEKRWAGRSTSWNQDCQEKYQ